MAAATGLAAACSQRVAPEIQAPQPAARESRSQVEPKTKKYDPQQDLVAPPPAYGNKVVMAKGTPGTSRL